MLADLAAFAVVAGLLTVVPGLDTALVLRSALTQGRAAGFAAAVGVNAGVLVWGVAAAVGVSAVLTASEVAFDALRLAGAAYVVWLGARLLVGALRAGGLQVAGGAAPAEPLRVHLRRGFVTNLLNPKVGVFYVALLPQFLPEGVPAALGGTLLALVHVVEGLVWLGVVALAAHAVRARLASPRVQRAVDGTTGVVLVGLGARLALSRG